MASSEGKTFRLRGIPAGLCKKDVERLVQNTLNCDDVNIRVRSLASDLDNLDEDVATVEFSPVPVAFQSTAKGDEWCLDTIYNDDDLSLLFDTNFLGPTPLHTPSVERWNLDLVAVSGLGGHAFGSFKARSGGFMWLRDVLPKDIPGARIIIYGTDTKLQESDSFQNLSHLGHRLRSTLHDVRAQSTDKPLVLMGHSLGGVIIKEAVIHMLRGDDIDIRNRLSIYGMLFFGVPNRGMSMESLVPMVGNQPNRFLLETLRAESEVLQKQTYSFLEAFPFPDSEILCCYETKRSPTAQQNDQGIWKMEGPATVFVSKDSATCLRAWETETRNTLAMNRAHSELVKFLNRYDEEYRPIRQRLVDFALKAAEVIPKRHATVGAIACQGTTSNSLAPEKRTELQNQCLQSLSFLEQDSRTHSLQPAEGTCDWIFEHEDFCSWLRGSLGLFWIGGKPGSGKSMLMKRVGIALQKSQRGLYSALIDQLYRPLSTAFEGLIREFQQRNDTRGEYGKKWEWSLEDLRFHLLEALKLGSETKSVMIFVDALDEAGEEEAQKIIFDFDGLLERLSGSDSKIKICFSCRHYPDLRLSHAVALSVEEHNRQDIQMVIDDHLQKLTPKEQNKFQREIVKKSGGIFHWATLVVDRAIRQRKKGKPFRTVFSTFQEGQADLYQLYEALLSELEEEDRVQAIRLFQWMLFAKRTLALRELQHAMALSHDMPENSIADYCLGKYFTDTDDLKAKIMDLSKGLVEVKDPVNKFELSVSSERASVHFIHQSVVDYLLESGLQKLEVTHNMTISSSIHVRANFQLSRSCLRMLFMSEFEGLPVSITVNPLLKYCWDHWIDHIIEIEKKGHPLPRYYRDCDGITSQDETEWQHLPDQYQQCDLLEYFSWPESENFLQICTRFQGLFGNSDSSDELQTMFSKVWDAKGIVHSKLAAEIWSFSYCGSSLIHFLALSGLKAPVQRMIDSPKASLEVVDHKGRTPLMYAILGSAVEIAMDLIHAKVKVNTQDIDGNTALHFASFCGKEHVVEELLQAGANVDLGRKGGATPLHLAAMAQHPLIVAKLLHANADPEKMLLVKRSEWDENNSGALMSTLACASLEGHHTIVEQLLSHCAQTTKVNEFGNSPLHYSASYGFVKVTRALIEAGALVDAQSPSGRTPLSMAIEYNHKDAAEILIRAGANVTLPDYDDWTPLDIAASNGYLDAARLLVSNGINFGRSLFHAALEGHANMVAFLIQSGANVEEQDRFGRTPLFFAVAGDQKEAAIRLIIAKTPLNHADTDGRTALFYAVARGHSTQMTRSLLDAGADPNWNDSKGLSPIVCAAYAHQHGILKTLLEFGALPPQHSAGTQSNEYLLTLLDFREDRDAYLQDLNLEMLVELWVDSRCEAISNPTQIQREPDNHKLLVSELGSWLQNYSWTVAQDMRSGL